MTKEDFNLYLCGPINGCSDFECKNWREEVKKRYPNCIDPMVRDYRGKEDEFFHEIVELDKKDIEKCQIVLVNYIKPSVGTSMEILYAYTKGKIIIIVVAPGTVISPWLKYHSTQIVSSFEKAFNYIDSLSAPINLNQPIGPEKFRVENLKHIQEVSKILFAFVKELLERAEKHDLSKSESPEFESYINIPDLSNVEYGSKEYKEALKMIKPAVEHHYLCNRHHIQHWPNGIEDMTLIDLLEMLADWKAASTRNKNGDVLRSLENNAKRFKISPQLKKILENTLKEHSLN